LNPTRAPPARLPPARILGLQRAAGNRATGAALRSRSHRRLLRLVREQDIRTEAERRWKRRGKMASTAAEQEEDWRLGTQTAGEIDAEARRLWQEKGGPDQTALEQERDWAKARHNVRQRQLAHDIWVNEKLSANQSVAEQAADWNKAGQQLEIEELWESCDPTILLPGETAAAVGPRVTAAVLALKAKPGVDSGMVDAILAHDHGRSPRPFVSAAAEDALGLGGHIVTKHIADPTDSADQARAEQAARAVTRRREYGGPCPGKAGSFRNLAEANTALQTALDTIWRQNGGWAAPNGWRNKLSKRQDPLGGGAAAFFGFEGTLLFTVNGWVQQKADAAAGPYPVADWPAYLFHRPNTFASVSARTPVAPAGGGAFPPPQGAWEALGGRPLFQGDTNFLPGMAPYLQPKANPADPDTYAKPDHTGVSQPIAIAAGNPLTTNVNPTGVTVRINGNPNAPGGWYINSAWPT
jgi:hypothetical protein